MHFTAVVREDPSDEGIATTATNKPLGMLICRHACYM